MYYICCRVSSDFWRPHEAMASTVLRPRRPRAAPADSANGCVHGVSPSQVWSSSFPAACSRHRFRGALPCHHAPKVGPPRFCHVCQQQHFRLDLIQAPPPIRLPRGPGCVQGALLRHHVSDESAFPVSLLHVRTQSTETGMRGCG